MPTAQIYYREDLRHEGATRPPSSPAAE